MTRLLPTPDSDIYPIEGQFNQQAALDVRLWLMTRRDRRSVIDFSKAQRCDDASLPVLAVTFVILQRRGRAIALRGLREHQVRILEHLGIELQQDGSMRVVPST